MKTKVIEDLVTITTIPTASFEQISDKIQWIICHAIEESQLEGEDLTEIEFDFGTLAIKVENDSVKYRFTPSKHFSKMVTSTIINKASPLTLKVESILKDRICNTYKELF